MKAEDGESPAAHGAVFTPGGPLENDTSRNGGAYLFFRRLTTPEDIEKALRLRFQVYAMERGFERPEDHPGGLERDRFDAVAVHFLCEHRDGFPVGTVRLIPPNPLGYPLEEHCELSIDTAQLPRDRLGEISRLAITRQFQRRREDPFNPAPPENPGTASPPVARDRRRNDLVLGLYREVYRATKELGVSHWYAAMEDKLMILLRRIGFEFSPIGPYVEYHGRRAPFLAEVATIERAVRDRSAATYEFFTQRI
jgi:N-acyl amino acid synthase of PEP-CTERM/exosortase system